MNPDDFFSTPEEAVKQLALELRELREMLREMSAKLSRIETRAKRTFPSGFPAKPKRPQGTQPDSGLEPPTISPDRALQLYDELVIMVRNGNRDGAERQLGSMGVSDLALLVKELGLSAGKSKPSSKFLISRILGRAKESVMLSKHASRDDSTSATPPVDPTPPTHT